MPGQQEALILSTFISCMLTKEIVWIFEDNHWTPGQLKSTLLDCTGGPWDKINHSRFCSVGQAMREYTMHKKGCSAHPECIRFFGELVANVGRIFLHGSRWLFSSVSSPSVLVMVIVFGVIPSLCWLVWRCPEGGGPHHEHDHGQEDPGHRHHGERVVRTSAVGPG